MAEGPFGRYPRADEFLGERGARGGGGGRYADAHPSKMNDQALLVHMRDIVQSRADDRLRAEGRWIRNLALFAGEQWVDYSPVLNRLVRVPRQPGQVRLVTNKTRRAVYNILGHMIGASVRYIPIPSRRGRGQRLRARAGIDVVSDVDRRSNMDAVLPELILWSLICGTGILKTTWNPAAGKSYPEDRVREALRTADPEVVALVAGRLGGVVREGQVERRVVPPFNFYPDGAHLISEMYGAVEIQRTSVERARDLFPGRADEIRADSTANLFGSAFDVERYASSFSAGSQGLTGAARQTSLWYGFWRPGPGGERGHYAVTTDDLVLDRGEFSDPWPFSAARYFQVPGHFFGHSLVDDAASIQTEINNLRSSVAQWTRHFSRPRWKAPIDSMDKSWTPDGQSGSVMWYKPTFGHEPRPMEYPPLPPGLRDYAMYLEDDFQYVTALSDVLRAQSAAGESGKLAAIKAEMAGAAFAAFLKEMKLLRETDARAVLKLAWEHYEEGRLLAIVGREGRAEVREFLRDRLDPQMDIEVVIEPLGQSRAIRRAGVIEAFSAGVLVDESGRPDFKTLRGALEFGDERGVYQSGYEEENEAYEQAERLLGGEPIEADKMEDHGIHIEVKSREYLDAKAARELTPAGTAAMRANLDGHMAMRAAELKAQARMSVEAQVEARAAQGAKGAAFGGLKPEQVRGAEERIPPEISGETRGGGGGGAPIGDAGNGGTRSGDGA